MQPITKYSQLDPNARFTYADYLTWMFDDLVELINGKIVKMSPAPISVHQIVSINLSTLFHTYLKRKPCKAFAAPFDVRLEANNTSTDDTIYTVVQPDICIICDPTKIDRRGCNGAPDLIVEILSDATMKKDLHDKYELYQANNVHEYWIINPEAKTLKRFALSTLKQYEEVGYYDEPGLTIPNTVLPDLIINYDDVFEF
jgi:Uma2 family endonuclease